MSIFNINQPHSDTISYNHPSVDKLKAHTPFVQFSDTGAPSSDRKMSLVIKERQSQHSASASKDVMVNNSYYIGTEKDLPPVSPTEIPYPPLDQGDTPTCQILPLLYKIQTQLDFPLDFAKLLDCLKPEFPQNTPIIFKFANYQKQYLDYYKRLCYLLYSGECFPVSKTYQSLCKNESQDVSNKPSSSSCDDNCSENDGIKISVIIEPIISKAIDLCSRVNSGYPVTLEMDDIDHIITITKCEQVVFDGKILFKFTGLDSIQPDGIRELGLFRADEDVLGSFGSSTMGFWGELNRVFPVVKRCSLNNNDSITCDEQHCADLNMIYNPNKEGLCKCDPITSTTPTVQPQYYQDLPL